MTQSTEVKIVDFDIAALFAAMDAQRAARGLSWSGVAKEIWELSSVLNARRSDHPISPATLTGMAKRNDTTCQHALFMLRWLNRSPESFLPGHPAPSAEVALPECGPDRRLRWNLRTTYQALDEQRRQRSMTWAQVASELHCGESQLTGLRTAKYATGLNLAMRIVQWLQRPARDFVYIAEW